MRRRRGDPRGEFANPPSQTHFGVREDVRQDSLGDLSDQPELGFGLAVQRFEPVHAHTSMTFLSDATISTRRCTGE